MMIDSCSSSKISNIIFLKWFFHCTHTWFFSNLRRDIRKRIKRKLSSDFYFFNTGIWNLFQKATFRVSYIVSKIQSLFCTSNKKIFSSTSHRNIHESTFFLKFTRIHHRTSIREESFLQSRYKYSFFFKSFCSMYGHKGY